MSPFNRQRSMRANATPKLMLLAALLAQAFPALPEPAQTPLLNRPESKPRPNVMFTLDDSGSMTYQYLPERDRVVNSKTISFPNDGKVFLHPKESAANKFSFDGSFADSFYVTAAPLTDLATDLDRVRQMQMRSPQVNGLYYDPSKRYRPWNTADGTAFANASPSKVWLNPMYYKPGYVIPAANQGDYVDLTTNMTADVKWYCSIDVGAPNYNNGACSSSSLTFRPAIVYLLKTPKSNGDLADPTSVDGYAEFDLSAAETIYPGQLSERLADGSCTPAESGGTKCSHDVELKNYANWFAFYRSRLFVAAGSIPDSLRAVQNSIRLGWGTIHPQHTGSSNAGTWAPYKADADIGSSATSGSVQQGVRPLTSAHLSNFTDWIRGITTLRRTPTLHAMYSVGDYFKRDATSNLYSPWHNDLTAITPNNASRSTPLSCRRAYHLVVTDGYYNTDAELKSYPDDIYGAAGIPFGSVGNADATAITSSSIPGSKNTTGLLTANVFTDTLPDTLADYAMSLWVTDLQSSIPNNVTPISQGSTPSTPPTTADLINEVKGDPATWQHLTHFMVGFGVTGTLTPSDDTLTALINGTLTWPTSLNRIDDLWHAAINSRGQYFAANNSTALQTSVAEALRLSSTALLKESGLATPSAQLTAGGTTAYIPEYNPVSWTGDIQARTLDANGKYGALPLWSANLRLVSAIASGTARNVFINDQGSIRAFSSNPTQYGALSTVTQAAISSNLATYLLGSSTDIDGLRPRATRTQTYPDGTSKLTRQYLSDIIDSNPLLITSGTDLGYNQINQDASYTVYFNDKQSRTENVLFVGANDGMLHAFKASTGDEVFAFIPSAAIPNLGKIAQVDYGYADSNNTHRYLVNGPLLEADVQLGTNKDWTNVVVGTMGTGGRSIFALKLNTKTPHVMNASSVLWEAQGGDSTTTNDAHADIGYVTAPPQIGRLPDGRWKVFVGNGVDSATGNASLLLLDMDNGAVTSVVAYQRSATGANSAANGMGGVVLIQDPNTNNVVGAYAGDMQGNVWRFDVTSTITTHANSADTYSDSQLIVAQDSHTNNTPLFTAPPSTSTLPDCPTAVPQSILANPVVVSNRLGGQLVVVNTGKLLTSCDAADKSVQTVYGLWDQTSFGSNQVTSIQTITRSQLQAQTVSLISGLDGFLSVSANPISWSSQMGWYMDLDIPSGVTGTANPHPKALFAPQRFGGSVLIGASIPSSPQESCTNDQSSTYYFFLKAISGSRALLASVDTNHDGIVDDHDNADAAGWVNSGERGRIFGGPSGSNDPTGCKNGIEIDPKTGQKVRDCGVVKDRIWRQLLNPPHP